MSDRINHLPYLNLQQTWIFQVIPITLAELPLYRYMSAISEIIASEQSGERWDPEWDRVMSTHPEAKSAEYDILVNSKPYFLYNATVSSLQRNLLSQQSSSISEDLIFNYELNPRWRISQILYGSLINLFFLPLQSFVSLPESLV